MLSYNARVLTVFLQIFGGGEKKNQFLASSNALEIVSMNFYIPKTNFRSP